MVMSCIACKRHGDEGAFFRLPKNLLVRKEWVERLELSEWFVTTTKVYRYGILLSKLFSPTVKKNSSDREKC